MQFIKETAKAWTAGFTALGGAIGSSVSDGVLTTPEVSIAIIAFFAAWFGAWKITNAEPTYSINQPSETK